MRLAEHHGKLFDAVVLASAGDQFTGTEPYYVHWHHIYANASLPMDERYRLINPDASPATSPMMLTPPAELVAASTSSGWAAYMWKLSRALGIHNSMCSTLAALRDGAVPSNIGVRYLYEGVNQSVTVVAFFLNEKTNAVYPTNITDWNFRNHCVRALPSVVRTVRAAAFQTLMSSIVDVEDDVKSDAQVKALYDAAKRCFDCCA